jgi:hypothetical protein
VVRAGRNAELGYLPDGRAAAEIVPLMIAALGLILQLLPDERINRGLRS